MKLIDFVDPHHIRLNFPFSSKKNLFEQLAISIGKSPKVVRKVYDSFVAREKLGNTSMGNGVALPHGKCLPNKEVSLRIVVLNKPVNYESVDNSKVQLIVALAFPENADETHCELLREAGAFFKKHRLFRELISAKTKKEFIEVIMKESG